MTTSTYPFSRPSADMPADIDDLTPLHSGVPAAGSAERDPLDSGVGANDSLRGIGADVAEGSDSVAPAPARSPLLQRVVAGAHATIDRIAEQAAPVVQRLEGGVAQAGETLQAKASDARHTGDEWAETVRTTVRDHPLVAVAAALGVGMLIARLTA